MKLFSAEQLQQLDALTMQHEPVSSINLMERASLKVVNQITHHYDLIHPYRKSTSEGKIKFFCGPGNNGGDGLCMATHLWSKGCKVEVFLIQLGQNFSADNLFFQQRAKEDGIKINTLTDTNFQFDVDEADLVIDAIFGIGINRPVSGFETSIIDQINQSGAKVISIDIPSGLMADLKPETYNGSIVEADITYTFQWPKLSFLFPSSEKFTGAWKALDIGIIASNESQFNGLHALVDKPFCQNLIKQREKFSHKGTFGHALIIGGSFGKMGAAVLASRACLKTGVGLVSAHVPLCGVEILQTTNPEAMVTANEGEHFLLPNQNFFEYDSIGIGVGMGTQPETEQFFKLLIQNYSKPIVIDADAINILAKNKTWLAFLPAFSILTPHPGELNRLVGSWDTEFEKVELIKTLCAKHQLILVLKGAHTLICLPNNQLLFNSSGNSGMATAGSGDVLTGIITGLLAQGYSATNAAIFGVYLHGLAGDFALNSQTDETLISSNIIENLALAFNEIKVANS